MSASCGSPTDATGWLHGPRYDLVLIVGVFALALALGGVAMLGPTLFAWVLLLDVWLLAYPHAASTFTRVAFDRASVRRHWFLLFVLPPTVFAAAAGTLSLAGLVALNTIYFTWQTWHYTRQSYGIARAYHRSSGDPAPRDLTSDVVVFAFPLWGLLHRAHQRPATFFDMPLWTPEVPQAAVVAAGVVALVALAAWTRQQLRALHRGAPRSPGLALFVLTHVVITLVSYVAVADITAGWLFINLWHNAQYLLFVWAMNARRFRGGVDPARPFLSRLCQPDQWVRYALVCLGLSTAFFLTLELGTERVTVLPLALLCYQTFNFHHYLIDAVIWRSRGADTRGAARASGRSTPAG